MARRTKSVEVKKLFYVASAATMAKEDKFYFQRFYPGDVVQLRGSLDRTEGVVIRSNIGDDGGTQVQFDGHPRVTLHNPRHLENVWEEK